MERGGQRFSRSLRVARDDEEEGPGRFCIEAVQQRLDRCCGPCPVSGSLKWFCHASTGAARARAVLVVFHASSVWWCGLSGCSGARVSAPPKRV